MITVYDLRNDHNDIKRIQSIIKEGRTPYRTKWGLYGTQNWWDALEKESLIQRLYGKISDIYMSGHNDFPEFEITTGRKKYAFPRIGKDKYYKIGKEVEVECIECQYILPSSTTDKVLHILSLKIEK